MKVWEIAGAAIVAVVVIGILSNMKDLLRYLKISSM